MRVCLFIFKYITVIKTAKKSEVKKVNIIKKM